MTVTDLSQPEIKEALDRTQLSLVFKQFKIESGTSMVQAAHGKTESFVIARHDDGSWNGWRLSDAGKSERYNHYGAMIKSWQDGGLGECLSTDGRKIKI